VNKPLLPSANPEILLKIGPLASEIQVLESRPLKNKNKGKTSAKCVGKFAERAKIYRLKRLAKNKDTQVQIIFCVFLCFMVVLFLLLGLPFLTHC